VAAIRAEVDALNALGSDPSTPVDPDAPPVEPPPIEVPADPSEGTDVPVDGAGDGTVEEPPAPEEPIA